MTLQGNTSTAAATVKPQKIFMKKEKLDRKKNQYNYILHLDITSVCISKHNSPENYKDKQDIFPLMQVWFPQHLSPNDIGNIYFPYINLPK